MQKTFSCVRDEQFSPEIYNILTLDSPRTPIRKKNVVSPSRKKKKAIGKEKRGKQKCKLRYLSRGKWELYNSSFPSVQNQNSISVHAIPLGLIFKILVEILNIILK